MKAYQDKVRVYVNPRDIRISWISLHKGCRQIGPRRVWDFLRKNGLRGTIRYREGKRSLRICWTLENVAWALQHGVKFEGLVPTQAAYLTRNRVAGRVYDKWVKSRRYEAGMVCTPTWSDIQSRCGKALADALSESPLDWNLLTSIVDSPSAEAAYFNVYPPVLFRNPKRDFPKY